jgi:hypothetical protein
VTITKAAYTQEEERLIKEWKVEQKDWRQGEAIVKQQIAATIPDSLFMKIRDKGTALEIWDALQNDFQKKSCMIAVDLSNRNAVPKRETYGHILLNLSVSRNPLWE